MKTELDITELYKEQGAFVARTIKRLLGEGPHVDDLLQETFIVAYKKRRRFDPTRGKSSTWLYGIVSKLCLHFERSRNRTGLFKLRLKEIYEGRAPSQSTGKLIEREQAIRLVHEELKKIPIKQREAFVLYELEGMTGKEISALLNIREGTVWTRIHHARKKFLKQVDRRMQTHV